jgi:iron complex transport system ATP-binding protein
MLELRSVRLVRDGAVLLDDASLVLEPGTFTAVIGLNGAGKSTLVRALTGEWKPVAGTVLVDGKPLSSHQRAALARRMAVVPQSSSLGFDFLVEEVVALGRTAHARTSSRARDAAVVSAALEQVGLSAFARRRFLTLSGGERQRVHLARALAQIADPQPDGPSALILDEPTSALDIAQQRTAMHVARRVAEGGAVVLAVLHDLNLALRHADRLIVLKGGRIVADGPCRSIASGPALSAWLDCNVEVSEIAGRPLAVAL